MIWEAIIDKDGKIVTAVIDREGVECSTIRQFTVGTELSDEVIGPECDKVEEIEG